MKYIPNVISVLRILLVFPTVYLLLQHQYSHALIFFMLAGLSDGLDGFLARRYGWVTKLGGYIDPMGDKLLMTASYLSLGYLQHLPWWLVAVVIGRDVVIVIGALLYRLLIAPVEMQPLLVSKINTAAQILLVLTFIFSVSTLPGAALIPAWAKLGLIWAVTITTILSGLGYVFGWGYRAVNAVKERE